MKQKEENEENKEEEEEEEEEAPPPKLVSRKLRSKKKVVVAEKPKPQTVIYVGDLTGPGKVKWSSKRVKKPPVVVLA